MVVNHIRWNNLTLALLVKWRCYYTVVWYYLILETNDKLLFENDTEQNLDNKSLLTTLGVLSTWVKFLRDCETPR